MGQRNDVGMLVKMCVVLLSFEATSKGHCHLECEWAGETVWSAVEMCVVLLSFEDTSGSLYCLELERADETGSAATE